MNLWVRIGLWVWLGGAIILTVWDLTDGVSLETSLIRYLLVPFLLFLAGYGVVALARRMLGRA